MPHPILALQIDALKSLHPLTDSSFALGWEGQRRGYKIFCYQPHNLVYQQGIIKAWGEWVHLDKDGYAYHVIDTAWLDLSEAKILLIRQDPPFDARYLSGTYLLELLENQDVRILNSPKGIRDACEKTLPLHFFDLIPPTLITENTEAAIAFAAQYEEIIVKPLYGYGGHDVISLKRPTRSTLASILDLYVSKYESPFILQPLLTEVFEEERRIHIINGRPVSTFRRIPKQGDVRANMAQGGSVEACTLRPRDYEICERIAPTLKEMGLYFVGIDVIGDYLIEINVTSPTGLRAAQKLYAVDIPKIFFDDL